MTTLQKIKDLTSVQLWKLRRQRLFGRIPNDRRLRSFAQGLAGSAAATEEICAAGLRGRGGAAFPAGTKLKMMQTNVETERYLVCNADGANPEPSRTGSS